MKKQIQNLSSAAQKSINANALTKAGTLISQIAKINDSLQKSLQQKETESESAPKGKKRAATAALKAAKEIAAFAAETLSDLSGKLETAKATEKAATEKIKAEKAEKAAKESAAKSGEKTANKAVLSATARGLNAYRNSYKGLLRDVSNDIHQNGKDSLYLKQITLAVYGGLQTEKIKGEESAAFVARSLKNGAAVTANIDITKTLLCSYLCNPQKMFKLFCDTLPSVEIDRNGEKVTCTFAKVRTVAVNAEKATIEIKESEDYEKMIINEICYYVNQKYAEGIDLISELNDKTAAKVLSRRRINGEKVEQNKYYIQSGNIVTLEPSDRVNFTQLLPAIATVCTAGALKSYDEKQKAAAAKVAAKQAKQAAAPAVATA